LDFICDFIKRKTTKQFAVDCPMLLTHSSFEPPPDYVDWNAKDDRPNPINGLSI
jgi:hypothetical protein